MRFTYPQVIWLLGLIPILILLHLRARAQRQKALLAFAGTALAPKLTRGMSNLRRAIKAGLLVAGASFLVLACARPRFGMRAENVHATGLDMIVALDVSNSMLAEDIQPSRLAKAKAEVASLIDRLQGDQIGLIAFAGIAFLQCPLTVDYSAARMLLDTMGPDLIPVGGTALGECIKTAREAFNSKELKYKVLILITDGEDTTGDPVAVAQEAAKQGIRIYTIGVGNVKGSLIPMKDAQGNLSGYKKDAAGKVVMSRMNATTLQRIAQVTGGRFYQATRDEGELERFLKDIQSLERREMAARSVEHMEDRFQLFVLLALICLVIETLIPERARETGEWGGRFA